MTVTADEIDILVDYCRTHLGDPDVWPTPAGYPDSLALCVIDSIYSTGSHYTSVVNVVDRYRAAHGPRDGAKALLQSISVAGGSRAWAQTVARNNKPAHTRPGAPLKADVIEQAATLLVKENIDTVEDLVATVGDTPLDSPIHDGWKRLPSQRSGVTYGYLLLLAGLPSVKPDRMVLRFLAQALASDARISTGRAVALMSAAANALEVSPRVLDQVIWRSTSGRRLID